MTADRPFLWRCGSSLMVSALLQNTTAEGPPECGHALSRISCPQTFRRDSAWISSRSILREVELGAPLRTPRRLSRPSLCRSLSRDLHKRLSVCHAAGQPDRSIGNALSDFVCRKGDTPVARRGDRNDYAQISKGASPTVDAGNSGYRTPFEGLHTCLLY